MTLNYCSRAGEPRTLVPNNFWLFAIAIVCNWLQIGKIPYWYTWKCQHNSLVEKTKWGGDEGPLWEGQGGVHVFSSLASFKWQSYLQCQKNMLCQQQSCFGGKNPHEPHGVGGRNLNCNSCYLLALSTMGHWIQTTFGTLYIRHFQGPAQMLSGMGLPFSGLSKGYLGDGNHGNCNKHFYWHNIYDHQKASFAYRQFG